jgi:hypothetical protein
MSDRTGLSRGDRNRNWRLARMRQLLPPQNAIVGIDLADRKQAAVVVADHDSRVIGRRQVSARAWELGELLDWAAGRGEGGWVRVGDGGVRADGAPVAGAGTSWPRSGACRWCACSRCWSSAPARART